MERAKTVLALTHPVTLAVAVLGVAAVVVVAVVVTLVALATFWLAIGTVVVQELYKATKRPKARRVVVRAVVVPTTVPVEIALAEDMPVALALAAQEVPATTVKTRKPRKVKTANPSQFPTKSERRHDDHATTMHMWHTGSSKAEIARQLEVSPSTVSRWLVEYSV